MDTYLLKLPNLFWVFGFLEKQNALAINLLEE